MQTPAAEQAPPLPMLRQELRLERDTARNRWLLHDPVRGTFHTIGEVSFAALSRWSPIPADEFLDVLNQADPSLDFTADDLQHLTEFLLSEKLLDRSAVSISCRFFSPIVSDSRLSILAMQARASSATCSPRAGRELNWRRELRRQSPESSLTET